MNDSQAKWNKRWEEKVATGPALGDPWLQQNRHLLPTGTALDIACGRGRNSLFLAELGLSVTAVDISPVALAQLDDEAQKRGLAIETLHLDLENQPQLPLGPFDLLLNFFYLHRPLLAQELARVRPGGIAIIRTFSQAEEDQFGPIRPEISLRPAELLEIFSGWKILCHEEGLEPSGKGGSLAGVVAQRPE